MNDHRRMMRTEIPGVFRRGKSFVATWCVGGQQFRATVATLEEAVETRERGRAYARSAMDWAGEELRSARMAKSAEAAATNSLIGLMGRMGIEAISEKEQAARRSVALKAVTRATAKCQNARIEWEIALRAARREGHTLHEIAAEAGVSQGKVWKVVGLDR